MRKIVLLIALIFSLALPVAVFAGAKGHPDGFGGPGRMKMHGLMGIDTSKMSDAQKKDMLDAWKKIMEAKKDAIRKFVANGSMDKAKGDAILKKMDEMIKFREKNGFDAKPEFRSPSQLQR